jgi:hypothetical protein
MCQSGSFTRPLVLRNCSARLPTSTTCSGEVDSSRMTWCPCADFTRMASSRALRFIATTKSRCPFGQARPSALAARFSDDISARWSICPRVSTVPTFRRERLPFSVSMSSSVMAIGSSSDRFASVTTSAVISLVSEAIGSTACEFLLNRTSLVSWSTTRATLDFSSSGSSASRSPASWPNEGRWGTTRAARTERTALALRTGAAARRSRLVAFTATAFAVRASGLPPLRLAASAGRASAPSRNNTPSGASQRITVPTTALLVDRFSGNVSPRKNQRNQKLAPIS